MAPEKLLKAFPDFEEYHAGQEKLFRRIKATFDDISVSTVVPIRQVATDVANLGVRVSTNELTIKDILTTSVSETEVNAIVGTAISASLASSAGGTIGGAIQNLSTVYVTPSQVNTSVSTAITASLASTAGGTIGGAIQNLSSVYATPSQVSTTVNSAITASLSSTAGGTIGGAIQNLSSIYATPSQVAVTVAVATTAAIAKRNRTFVSPVAPTYDPTDPFVVGDVWVDTTNGNALKAWGGSSWSDTTIASGAITSAVANKNKVFAQGTAPAATAVGDLWFNTSDNNRCYRWDGTGWAEVSDARVVANTTAITSLTAVTNSKTKTSVQATAPSSPSVGDLWVMTTENNRMYSWTGAVWLAVDDGNKVSVYVQGTAPTARAVGDIWFNSSDSNKMYRWSGSGWALVSDDRIATQGTRITDLESQVQTPVTGLLARVTQIESTYATDSEALATAQSVVSASIASSAAGSIGNAISASVSSEATARATADGFLTGKYALRVTTGNVVTGMEITSSTAANGGTTSTIIFQAGVVKFQRGAGNVDALLAGDAAADVNAGATLISGSKIVTGSVTAAKINVTDLGDIAASFTVGSGYNSITATSGRLSVGDPVSSPSVDIQAISTSGSVLVNGFSGRRVELRSFGLSAGLESYLLITGASGVTAISASSSGIMSCTGKLTAGDFETMYNVDVGNAVRTDRVASRTGVCLIKASTKVSLDGTVYVEDTADFRVLSTMRQVRGPNYSAPSYLLAPFLHSIVHCDNQTSRYGLFVGTNWAASENIVLQVANVDGGDGTVNPIFTVRGDSSASFAGRVYLSSTAYLYMNGTEIWVSDSFSSRRV